jgi:maltooligosyltrehalose trehalohydrolase
VFRLQGAKGLDGAVLSREALVLRFFGEGGEEEDRLLVINLGTQLRLVPAPEPLLAPPAGARWEVLWSSEDPRYGGQGAADPESEEEGWCLPGQAAIVLRPASRPRRPQKSARDAARTKKKKEPKHG